MNMDMELTKMATKLMAANILEKVNIGKHEVLKKHDRRDSNKSAWS
jgi:predicted DsbA family dithiol-disulfide isomerase